jgi:hypothetical protein
MLAQVSPSSPGGGLPPAHKRLLREAEPADSGHSGHTPKAGGVEPGREHASADAPGGRRAPSAFQFAQVRMRARALEHILGLGSVSNRWTCA